MSVMVTSPSLAYSTMLRTTSETAVAMIVRLLCEKPARDASARACWRAATTSAEDWIRTCTSLSCPVLSSSTAFLWTGGAVLEPMVADRALFEPLVQEGQAFLKVEGRGHILEGQPELDHRQRDVRLNAHDDRLGAAKFCHVGDRTQRPRGKRVQHVEGGHVDDDASRAVPPHAIGEIVSKPDQILVAQRRLDARDQVLALLENWNFH